MKRMFLFITFLFFVLISFSSSVFAKAGWGESCKYEECYGTLKCCSECKRCYNTCPNCICCDSKDDCKNPYCGRPSLDECDLFTNKCEETAWKCNPDDIDPNKKDNIYIDPSPAETNKVVTIKVNSIKPYPWVVLIIKPLGQPEKNLKGPKYWGSSGILYWWKWEYTPTSPGDYITTFFVDTTENQDPSKGNKCLEKSFKVEGEGTTTLGTTVGTTMPGTTVGTTVPGGACKLNSVSITVICPNGCCEQNDVVNMEGSISGDCSAIDFFQVDAKSSDGACNIEYVGGDMRGISGIVTDRSGNSLKASWQIPSISSDCQGKSIMGKIAGLYDGGPPGTGTSKTFTTNVGGSFTFCSGPTSTSTTSTSTTTTTTTSSTTTSTTVSTTTSITSTSTTTTITTTSSTVSTTTTMTTTTTQPTTTVSTTTSTTTTIPLVVKFTCSNCESVGNTCTCEVTGCKNGLFGATGIPSSVLEQGIFDIFNFNDYTSTYANSFDLKKEGILKVGLACVDPMKLEIKEYKVKPEMLTCPSSIAVGDTGVCKVRGCTMGIFIAKGNPLDNDISEIFGGDMDVSMTPSKTGTINVGLGCVNPNAFKFVDITVS